MIRAAALVTTVVVALLPITAAAQDGAPAPSAAPNPVVLKVNGEEVRAAEISIVMLNLRAQVGAAGESPGAEELLEVATQRVIEQRLLAQEARRFGLSPDPERVEQLFQAAVEQAGGSDALARTLESAGSSTDELRAMLENLERARLVIAERIAPTVEVTDEEIERYYADHSDEFVSGERIRPRHIVFAVPADAGPEADQRARERAEAARRRVLDGEPFADVARELSEGPSAARGGDIGLVPPTALEKPFADAALALEPGEISEIVRTPYGYHVITVVERQPAGARSLDEVRDAIESRLRQQRTAETVARLLETLSERADVEVLDADAAIATPGA